MFGKFFKKNVRCIEEYKTVEELEKNRKILSGVTIKDKKSIRIAFLDDEGFDCTVLKSLGYLDIEVMEKFNKINDFENYDIVFCDINGIGKEIDEVYQGAAVAKLLKNTYPSKVVVIFSAKEQSLDFNKYNEVVDLIIPKNIRNSELSEIIDQSIKLLNDPVEFWRNMRNQMIKQNVPTTSIAILEDCYVRGILEKEDVQGEMDNEILKINVEGVAAIVKALCNFIMAVNGLSE